MFCKALEADEDMTQALIGANRPMIKYWGVIRKPSFTFIKKRWSEITFRTTQIDRSKNAWNEHLLLRKTFDTFLIAFLNIISYINIQSDETLEMLKKMFEIIFFRK